MELEIWEHFPAPVAYKFMRSDLDLTAELLKTISLSMRSRIVLTFFSRVW